MTTSLSNLYAYLPTTVINYKTTSLPRLVPNLPLPPHYSSSTSTYRNTVTYDFDASDSSASSFFIKHILSKSSWFSNATAGSATYFNPNSEPTYTVTNRHHTDVYHPDQSLHDLNTVSIWKQKHSCKSNATYTTHQNPEEIDYNIPTATPTATQFKTREGKSSMKHSSQSSSCTTSNNTSNGASNPNSG